MTRSHSLPPEQGGPRTPTQPWEVPHRDSGTNGTNPTGLTAQELDQRLRNANQAQRDRLDSTIGRPGPRPNATTPRRHDEPLAGS